MKKVLLIVFMFVLTIPVYGLENVKYKYYRLNRVNGPLVFKNEANEEFPLIDEENPIKGELSELSLEKPELKDGREIYEYDGYHYLQIPLIDEIEIRTDSLSSISQIRISLLNGEVNYETESDGNLGHDEKANFVLSRPVTLNNLMIKYRTGVGDNFHWIVIDFKSEGIIASSCYISAAADSNHSLTGNRSVLNDSALKNVYLPEKSENTNLKYVGETKLYQYFDYQYQSYKIEKEYYPDYLSEPIGDYIYKDSDDYIIVNDELDNENSNEESSNVVLEESKSFEKNDKNYLDTIDNALVNDVKEIPKKIENKKLNESNTKDKIDSPDTSVLSPKQYQSVLKVDDKKTSSNGVNTKVYYYFVLVLLVILLLIMLKIRNRFRQSYRWYLKSSIFFGKNG